MKTLLKTFTKYAGGLVAACLISSVAYAGPILGTLIYVGDFAAEDGSGNVVALGSADFLNFSTVLAPGAVGTGDLSVLSGTSSIDLADFSIDPFASPTLVWSEAGAGDISFSLTSLVIETQTDSVLHLTGFGEISATGFTTSTAEWALTTQSTAFGTIVTFSAGTSVPEPGMLTLLGFTLVGLGLARRFKLKPVKS